MGVGTFRGNKVLRRFIGRYWSRYTTCCILTVRPGVEPFDPANPLIFVGSPLVGTRLTTSSKFAVLTKSPLTGLHRRLAVVQFHGNRAQEDWL